MKLFSFIPKYEGSNLPDAVFATGKLIPAQSALTHRGVPVQSMRKYHGRYFLLTLPWRFGPRIFVWMYRVRPWIGDTLYKFESFDKRSARTKVGGIDSAT